MDVKVGDVVHVRGTVAKTSGGRRLPYEISFGDGSLKQWVPVESLVHVEPRPIAVGDTVQNMRREVSDHHQARMHVNAVVGGRAWCRSSGYDYIIEVENLERVS